MNYLYPQQILYLHKRILEVSGGSPGTRDQGLLESAVYRPQASFGGHDLYPDLFSKAAALLHSLIKNHPFLDGNKRTAFEAMRLFLVVNGLDLKASEAVKFDFVIKTASAADADLHELARWIEARAVPRPRA